MKVAPRLLTGLCYGAMMCLSIGLNLLPVFLTSLGAAYGGESGSLTQEQLGRLTASPFGGVVLGILLAGPLVDRWGPKLFAQLGNGLMAGGLLWAAFAPSYLSLAVALFWMGLGAGILDMVLSPVVAALNPERRAVAMNWLHSFYCVGAVVTILIGTVALESGLGWRGGCLVLLVLPLALTLSFAPMRFPALVPEGAGVLPVRRLLRQWWFWGAMLAIAFGGATELGIAQWLPAYTERSLGYSPWIGGVALLLFSVAMVLGRMVVGVAGAKWDMFRVMAWGCGASVVFFVAGSFLPIPWMALTACIVVGFTGSCLWPTMLGVTANRYPTGGASMYGLLAAAGNVGGVFMPWAVGVVADHSNMHWGLVISALAPALMLPLVLALGRRAG
ncbi:MFS transporter [Cephaloticoccus primus]|uniref:MFS transporter n=1 Tax=Cephaloticoccus primus TaxID=1548207 RepID=A0A139ST56_9BACT|nr:MFS transporter [Cephaloticoccus primus]KXU37753.1 MFS transporter [Cephaloticoccus primus]